MQPRKPPPKYMAALDGRIPCVGLSTPRNSLAQVKLHAYFLVFIAEMAVVITQYGKRRNLTSTSKYYINV